MQARGLTARNLMCRRGERVLFTSLDLRLDAGEALHLTGPNGVGKTSLIQILAGLLRAEPGGEVTWQGTVGLLDERLALDEHLPLGKALRLWAQIDGKAVALEPLGLAGLEDVPVGYLSTGQRKRAGLARLLGQNGEHWLLDEPLNGLDAQGQALLESLIAEKRAAGGVVIVASHQSIALPGAQVLDLGEQG